jgi:hypothetical protein
MRPSSQRDFSASPSGNNNRRPSVLRWLGIRLVIARRGRVHGRGPGETRGVVERSLAWVRKHRLRVRYEKRLAVHQQAFLEVACVHVCHKTVTR